MNTQHTPTPWKYRVASDHRNEVIAADGQFICQTVIQQDALDIVRACNSHAALVAALEGAIKCGVIGVKYADPTEDARAITDDEDMAEIRGADPSLVVDFRAALASAKGQP